MKRVILTVGPMYAGKTTFCRKIRELVPGIVYVRRDDILERHFGSAWVSPYECPPAFVEQQLQWAIAMAMGPAAGDSCIVIVDTWNGSPRSRSYYCDLLRRYGADRVEGWFFITPPEVCLAHSFLRDPLEDEAPRDREWSRRWREEHVLRDTKRFYAENPPCPRTEHWFDEVRAIRPLADDPRSWIRPYPGQIPLPGMGSALPPPVLL
jgi:predicted kinase